MADTGARGSMAKAIAADVPPPGLGLITVTGTDPAVATSAAAIAARSTVPPTNVVARGVPFHWTVAPVTKALPFTVNSNAALPATTLAGLRELTTGIALPIVNVTGDDVPPPGVGLTTVTWVVPVLAMSLAGTAAVSWVPLTNVVVRVVPFQCTEEPVTKPVPLTVSVNAAPPTAAVVGDTEVRTGTGFLDLLSSSLQPATTANMET